MTATNNNKVTKMNITMTSITTKVGMLLVSISRMGESLLSVSMSAMLTTPALGHAAVVMILRKSRKHLAILQ